MWLAFSHFSYHAAFLCCEVLEYIYHCSFGCVIWLGIVLLCVVLPSPSAQENTYTLMQYNTPQSVIILIYIYSYLNKKACGRCASSTMLKSKLMMCFRVELIAQT